MPDEARFEGHSGAPTVEKRNEVWCKKAHNNSEASEQRMKFKQALSQQNRLARTLLFYIDFSIFVIRNKN